MSANKHQKKPRIKTEPKEAAVAGPIARFATWAGARPIMAILLVSLVAVAVNCYPVIFCGRSFVSPASVSAAVYSWWPPVPGVTDMPRANQHGSDTGGTMWQMVPWSFLQSRCLLDHGELPLWNRYSFGGQTLIGQGLSQFGDPLHFIVLLGRGSAWAWDLKFLAAKFLFCVGFGCLVLRLLGSGPLALVYSALAAYCGAYFFIYNHPSFFVLAYAPWILLAGIEMLDRQSKRARIWFLVWLVANFGCFNAGMLSVSVVLIAGLNLTALAYALAIWWNTRGVKIILGRLIIGAVLFLGLSAPWWLSFLGAMDGSFSLHMAPKVVQLPLKTLPGAFDEIFYRILGEPGADPLAPGTNLLVLVGCILSVLRWRRLRNEPFFWVNSGAIILWGGIVFGWIPGFLIAGIPFLNRVGHTHTDFSYLLVIQLMLQSAYGFKTLAGSANAAESIRDFAATAGIIAVGLFGYYTLNHPADPHMSYVLVAALAAILAPFTFELLRTQNLQMHPVGWAAILLLAFIPIHHFGYYHAGNQESSMVLGPRVRLDSPSKAVDQIKKTNLDPFRVTGLQKCFIGEYPVAYELEDIRSAAPLQNGRLSEIIRHFPGIEAALWGWVVDVIDPVRAQPLLNMLNVKYLLAHPSTNVQGRMDFRISDRSDFLVLENLQVWPRAFFSDKVVRVSSSEDFIKYLSENGTHPFVAIEKEEITKVPELAALESLTKPTVVQATNYQLGPNSTSFDIQAPSAGVVCLTEAQAAGFDATVNGVKKQILAVNRAFKGILLDKPGTYRVIFTYRPAHWTAACILFWASIAGIATIIFTPVGRLIYNPERATAGPTLS